VLALNISKLVIFISVFTINISKLVIFISVFTINISKLVIFISVFTINILHHRYPERAQSDSEIKAANNVK
jgi:hypothetical protein